MDGIQIITAPGLASLLIEFVKFVLRKFFFGEGFDFSKTFYAIMLPIMTFASRPLLALLEIGSYVFPTDLGSWTREFIVVILSSVFTVFIYNGGIKPLKDYRVEN